MQGVEFLSVMEQMVGAKQLKAICREHSPKPRSQPKVSSEALIKSLIFHQLQPGGTLAEHGAQLHGIKMSDSANSQRRQLLPVELFDQLMEAGLQPLADPVRQPASFYELIGDRLFGTPHTLWQAMRAWQDRDVQALVRVRDNINAEILKRLSDGSALVAVRVEHEGRTVASLQLRKLPASRMSFYKLMLATQQLWSTLQFMGGVLSKAQRRHVWEQYVETVRHTAVFPCAASAGQFMATQN